MCAVLQLSSQRRRLSLLPAAVTRFVPVISAPMRSLAKNLERIGCSGRSAWTTVTFDTTQTLQDVQDHLSDKRHGAALVSFKKQLGNSDGLSLEQGIMLFGQHQAHVSMLKAFKSFIRAGYNASARMWTSILQITSIKPEELQELARASRPNLMDEKLVAALMRYHALAGRADMTEEVFARYEQMLAEQGSEQLPGPLIWKSLINARGVVGDLLGAKAWFDVWRTSKAHPYGFMEEKQKQSPAKLVRPGLPGRKTGTSGLLPTQTTISRSALRELPRSAHSMVELPAPDAQPYLALLRHIVDQTPRPSSLSLDLLDLMAADRVPLSTSVMNGLIYHELARDEAMSTESILALYEKMRESNVDGVIRPDSTTFRRVFDAYREPRLDFGRPLNPPLPTQLARKNGSPMPSARLLENPRQIFHDMMSRRRERILGGELEDLVDTALLDTALRAFVKTRDFVGATVVLDTYKRLQIEPSSRTHAVIVMGVWRALKRKEAFQSQRGRKWLSREKLEELTERVQALNDLAGYDPHPASQVLQIQPILQPSRTPPSAFQDAFLVSRPAVHGQLAPFTWNKRKVPRTSYELRKTRKFEMRDLQDLSNLLWMASPFCDTDNQSWARKTRQAESEMWLEWEARW